MLANGGAERDEVRSEVGVGVAANIFIGMVEAPLLIKPYMAKVSRSELFTIMTCGMATIAGTVIVLYASILAPVVPDALGHLLAASIISAPPPSACAPSAPVLRFLCGRATCGFSCWRRRW